MTPCPAELAPVRPSPAQVDRWFRGEVLATEAALTRYLRRNWRDGGEIEDLRQDIYVRAFDAARAGLPRATRAFLFSIARNLLIDRSRHRQVVSIWIDPNAVRSDPAADMPGPEQIAAARGELAVLQRAIDALPPRCRRVVWLRKVEGLPQREVAAQLGITEDTVERQVVKGVRLLADHLFARGVAVGGRAGARHARR